MRQLHYVWARTKSDEFVVFGASMIKIECLTCDGFHDHDIFSLQPAAGGCRLPAVVRNDVAKKRLMTIQVVALRRGQLEE